MTVLRDDGPTAADTHVKLAYRGSRSKTNRIFASALLAPTWGVQLSRCHQHEATAARSSGEGQHRLRLLHVLPAVPPIAS